MERTIAATVAAVHRESVDTAARNQIKKSGVPAIRLLDGLGVEGDRHCGPSMKNHNRFRGPRLISNVRQVHLISLELQAAYAQAGFTVRPGDLGENITTCGIDLLLLPTGAVLHIGEAAVQLTGFRTPCFKLDKWRDGLKAACLELGPNGESRKPGVMGVVKAGGEVRPGDAIGIDLPPEPTAPLKAV
jgi:MOSC domain-containing protein YiiM